ncbi:hypothetical protein CPB84DRAFT_1855844 [Gymnopilus junonius]|uniref:Uncharacterized protein n=1 Tax=Gymnopilus junonius TaxID=109634 RepID=A0A9P5TFA1_GYMJU|nr:hypothetical protein CPB84DRAFT_1855844 [Gymnopilus junonius]
MPEDVQHLTSSPPPFSSSVLFLYNYRGRRVVASCEVNYQRAIQKCRDTFAGISDDSIISFFTDELYCSNGKLAEISEESWEEAVLVIKSVFVVVNRRVEIIDPPSSELGVNRLLLLPEFHIGDQTYSFQIYVTPTTKLRKVVKEVASEMGIEEAGLFLTHQG